MPRVKRRWVSLVCCAGTVACVAQVSLNRQRGQSASDRLHASPPGTVRFLTATVMPGQDRRFAEHVRGRSLYFAKVFVNDGRDVRYTRVTPTVAPDPTDGHLYFDFGYPIRVVDFHSVEVWAVSDRRRWEMERLVDARVVDRRQTIDGDLLHFALH